MGQSVRAACTAHHLDTVDLGGRTARTQHRQQVWNQLPPSARIVFHFYTARQPQGWRALVNHVQVAAGCSRISYLQAIDPLLTHGWLMKVTPHRGFIVQIWLTREGRAARQHLKIAGLRQRNLSR